MQQALLIIDVQQGLFSPSPQPYRANEVVTNINRLVIKARAQNTPIIFIQHEDPTDLIYPSDNWQLYTDLNSSSSDHFIRKTTPDSFHNTELQSVLQKLKVKHCVICGYASEFCIDTTTRRAAALEYTITLVSDGHTTHDKSHLNAEQIIKHHTSSLTAMTSFGVPIMAKSTQEIDF